MPRNSDPRDSSHSCSLRDLTSINIHRQITPDKWESGAIELWTGEKIASNGSKWSWQLRFISTKSNICILRTHKCTPGMFPILPSIRHRTSSPIDRNYYPRNLSYKCRVRRSCLGPWTASHRRSWKVPLCDWKISRQSRRYDVRRTHCPRRFGHARRPQSTVGVTPEMGRSLQRTRLIR